MAQFCVVKGKFELVKNSLSYSSPLVIVLATASTGKSTCGMHLSTARWHNEQWENTEAKCDRWFDDNEYRGFDVCSIPDYIEKMSYRSPGPSGVT